MASYGQGYGQEDYYDEEDPGVQAYGQMLDDDDGSSQEPARPGNQRQLTATEEKLILQELAYSAGDNREFMKVLHILQNDGELRPLIFEHEALLKVLKDMRELKAEQMLSILTAAETEMYESSKKNEEMI